MKIQTAVRVLSLLLGVAPVVLPGRAASFSADLIDTRGGQTTTGTFHYQDKGYRFDFGGKDQPLTLMVDGPSGTMRLLNPAEKAYYEAGPSEPMSLFANPFALYAHYSRTKEVRTEGSESVGGVPCKKQVVSGGGQVFVTAWVSDEFEVPLKVQTQLDGRTVELRNIRRGPQDPALFALPAGYRLTVVKEEREPQPEWAGQVKGAPLLTPPFEKTLTAGGIVRMRPQAGRGIEIAGTNTGQGQGSFTSARFKGGKYLGDGSRSTVTLDQGDSSGMSDGVGPDKADEIVVHVNQGTMKIKTAFVASRSVGPKAASAVEEPATAERAAAVNAPSSAGIATQILVEWMGPGKPEDFIAVARPDQPPGASLNRTLVREGSPLKLWMPSDAGEYEVRYILGRGSKLLAKTSITVNAVPAEVAAAGPVNVADWIVVNWKGPAAEGDFISVARAGQPAASALSRVAVKSGNPVKVRAPGNPGEYEVRYILGRGSKLLAKTPITLSDVTAQLEVPASAKAGDRIEVRWQGPNADGDVITLARPDQAAAARVVATATRQGNPLQLRAPKEPGTYEVRYLFFGGRVLAKATITIAAP